MKFIATDINWEIDYEYVYEILDNMCADKAAHALGIGLELYSNMSTTERHDYAYDLFRHSRAELDEFLGLPDEVEIPDEFGITSIEDDFEEVTDWLSDTYGYLINGYNVVRYVYPLIEWIEI